MPDSQKYGFSFLLIFLLVLLLYSNTFNASWHLDDYHSIVNNRFLHIDRMDLRNLQKAVTENNININRPFSNLTFAVNWLYGKDDVTGYHIVNTGIHVFTTFFLFLTILFLFKTPNLKGKYDRESIYFISFLSAVLWSANPIQTQSVTYIVQRMSSMAGMFYVIALFLFINGRLFFSGYKKLIIYLCAFLVYLLALGTKENTIILPLSLILAEIVFFQDLANAEIRRKYSYVAAVVAVIIILAGIYFFMGGGSFNIFRGYESRYFTPGERLLTEARIIVWYLSLIFYPSPARLSIEHDIDISTSFLNPWTTTPSIIIIVALIGFGILQARRRPLLGFAILFFFLNHLIESTVIGLELIFEHRNYIPSFFLFVPVCMGLKQLIDKYHEQKGMHLVILSFVVLLLIGYGSGTYIRNLKWNSEVSLLTDAIKKAPQSARLANNFAKEYFEGTGQYGKAIELYHKALYLKTHNRYYKGLILNNIAGIYYHHGNYLRAGKFWEKAAEINPVYKFPLYGLALVSVKKNDRESALGYLGKIDFKNQDNRDVLNLKGVILFNQGRQKEAFYNLRKCLLNNGNEIKSKINIGAAYCLTGEYGKALLFLEEAHKRKQRDLSALVWLIETGLRSRNDKVLNRYAEKICSSMSVNELAALKEKLAAENFSEDGVFIPVLQKKIADVISEKIKTKFTRINHIK